MEKKMSQTNGILNANGIFSHSFANEAFLLLRDFHQAATLTKNAYLQQYEYCIAKDTLLRESHDLDSELKYSEIIQWWSMCKQLTTAIVLALAASESKKIPARGKLHINKTNQCRWTHAEKEMIDATSSGAVIVVFKVNVDLNIVT